MPRGVGPVLTPLLTRVMSLGVLSSFRIVCVRGAGGPDAAANEEHDETSYRGVRNFECSLSFKSLRSALVSLTYKNEKADRSPARSAVRLSLRGHAREISRTSRLAHLICAARSTATTSTQSSASHTARLHTIMDGFTQYIETPHTKTPPGTHDHTEACMWTLYGRRQRRGHPTRSLQYSVVATSPHMRTRRQTPAAGHGTSAQRKEGAAARPPSPRPLLSHRPRPRPPRAWA